MRFIAVLLASALFVSTVRADIQNLGDEEYQFLFTQWMKEHDKTFDHDIFFHKYNVFKANLNKVRLHNAMHAETKGYTLGMNQFGDLTQEEFRSLMGTKQRVNEFLHSKNVVELSVTDLPDSIDWVSKGAVTPVKNQGQCGSCWSFSTTGAIEGVNYVNTGKLVSLSEQQLVDCSGPEGDQGCNGGLMDNAFEYVIKNGGICTEEEYSYTATDGTCRTCQEAVKISGYTDVTPKSEEQMRAAVSQHPVSVAIEADSFSFQFYSGGVLSSDCGAELDHGVLVVGYGEDNGKKFWKVKNSWGESWGESGYLRIERGSGANDGAGMCGILSVPSYPTQ
jgi:cathepsin L